jgi:hypothetical protein
MPQPCSIPIPPFVAVCLNLAQVLPRFPTHLNTCENGGTNLWLFRGGSGAGLHQWHDRNVAPTAGRHKMLMKLDFTPQRVPGSALVGAPQVLTRVARGDQTQGRACDRPAS